jgi:hypothetical protein
MYKEVVGGEGFCEEFGSCRTPEKFHWQLKLNSRYLKTTLEVVRHHANMTDTPAI